MLPCDIHVINILVELKGTQYMYISGLILNTNHLKGNWQQQFVQ